MRPWSQQHPLTSHIFGVFSMNMASIVVVSLGGAMQFNFAAVFGQDGAACWPINGFRLDTPICWKRALLIFPKPLIVFVSALLRLLPSILDSRFMPPVFIPCPMFMPCTIFIPCPMFIPCAKFIPCPIFMPWPILFIPPIFIPIMLLPFMFIFGFILFKFPVKRFIVSNGDMRESPCRASFVD